MQEYMPIVYLAIGVAIVLGLGKVIGDRSSKPLSEEEVEAKHAAKAAATKAAQQSH